MVSAISFAEKSKAACQPAIKSMVEDTKQEYNCAPYVISAENGRLALKRARFGSAAVKTRKVRFVSKRPACCGEMFTGSSRDGRRNWAVRWG